LRTWQIPVLLLAAALLVSGCVSKSTHQRKVDEAIHLADTVRGLESDYQQLVRHKDALVASNDELTRQLTAALEKSSSLQQDLLRARADIDRLEKVLSARSEETGQAMSEMRQTIDRLQTENQELAHQVEQERLAREARIAQMKSTYDELVQKMEAEIQRGEITISELQGKLTVNMVDRILFDSGKADIKPAGLEVLKRVGDILKEVADKDIRVEGHTDDVPISPRLQQSFPSNWELSTARATNVVHFLQDRIGIAGERLSACGFSQYSPVAANDTPEERAQNRRIQIELVPLEAKVVKPL
jgi:chemotaxis protein MotB